MKKRNKLMVLMVALSAGASALCWWVGLVYDPANGKGMRILAVIMMFVLLIVLWVWFQDWKWGKQNAEEDKGDGK